MILIAIAALLAGILIGHGYHAVKGLDRDEELRQAREDADFWHEHCDNWHQLAVAAGAGQRRLVPAKAGKVQRINVPRPP